LPASIALEKVSAADFGVVRSGGADRDELANSPTTIATTNTTILQVSFIYISIDYLSNRAAGARR